MGCGRPRRRSGLEAVWVLVILAVLLAAVSTPHTCPSPIPLAHATPAVVVTLGPSCQSVDVLVELLAAGMTCARVDLTVRPCVGGLAFPAALLLRPVLAPWEELHRPPRAVQPITSDCRVAFTLMPPSPCPFAVGTRHLPPGVPGESSKGHACHRPPVLRVAGHHGEGDHRAAPRRDH